MTIIALAAAKSSPGVSTAAELMALARPTPRRTILLDADPNGGDWLVRPGAVSQPGLLSLAAAGRRALAPGEVSAHLQRFGDLEVLVAPAAARQAGSALELLSERLVDHLRALEATDVVIDTGCLAPASPALPLVAGADLAVLLAPPVASALVHLAPWVDHLGALSPQVAVVLSGPVRPGEATYSAREVAEALGVAVAGTLAADPEAAALLHRHPGCIAPLARSALWASARPVAEALFAMADQAAAEVHVDPSNARLRSGLGVGL